jgi:hypothetical protein
MCHTHYKYWRWENVPGARAAHLKSQREAVKKRRAAGKVKDDRYKSKEYRQRHYLKAKDKLLSSYVRRSSKLPLDAPTELVEMARQRLILKRLLKGLKCE